MSSAYIVETIDLANVRDRTPIISTLANPVSSVHAIVVPGAASLHFGQGGQPWPIIQGKSYEPCPPESDGIFVTNVPSSGLMILGISFVAGAIIVRGGDESLARAGQIAYAKTNQAGSLNSGPAVQLKNPIGSGKVILLPRVHANSATNGNIYLVIHRNTIGNNGGGVLTSGSKRFLDRFLAPADPMTVTADAGISGLIQGTTFDNNFFTEFGLAPGAAANIPPTSAFMTLLVAGGINQKPEFLDPGQFIRLPEGWGCTVQHGVNGAGVQMSVTFFGSEGGV